MSYIGFAPPRATGVTACSYLVAAFTLYSLYSLSLPPGRVHRVRGSAAVSASASRSSQRSSRALSGFHAPHRCTRQITAHKHVRRSPPCSPATACFTAPTRDRPPAYARLTAMPQSHHMPPRIAMRVSRDGRPAPRPPPTTISAESPLHLAPLVAGRTGHRGPTTREAHAYAYSRHHYSISQSESTTHCLTILILP